MVKPTSSGCINHPGVEAVARCKQCGKPVCSACLVTGPTGNFCSQACKEKHQEFIKRAQSLQRSSRGAGNMRKLGRFAIKLVIFLVVVGAICLAALRYPIPVLSDVVRAGLGFISGVLPF